MLIKSLCDYYDRLSKNGKIPPRGYGLVHVSFVVSLTPDGKIDGITDIRTTKEFKTAGGKTKRVKTPVYMVMPQRFTSTKPTANIPEQRPLYLFGLNRVGNKFTPVDKTHRASISHKLFVKKTAEFFSDLDSPLINAYRNFAQNWNPNYETENEYLEKTEGDYQAAGYAFCLSGHPDKLLQDEPALKAKWDRLQAETDKDAVIAQCAVTGEDAPIERVHDRIMNVSGGRATGNVLVGYNSEAFCSYGNIQGYNCNISVESMTKYTVALNYLYRSESHHTDFFDDLALLYWSSDPSEECEKHFKNMLLTQFDSDEKEQNYFIDGENYDGDNDDFYVLIIKPNASRLSVKLFIEMKFCDVERNISKFRDEMRLMRSSRTASLYNIIHHLCDFKNKNERADPALVSKLVGSIIRGTAYPDTLITTLIRLVKNDVQTTNYVRVGLIRAFINRNRPDEYIKECLDSGDTDPVYLCGRLFAVLEDLQTAATKYSMARTIKDTYFSSAMSNPSLVFPKLLKLSQNNLNRYKYPPFYKKAIREITDVLNNEFPGALSPLEQGRFILGYYLQYQDFFEKNENKAVKEK